MIGLNKAKISEAQNILKFYRDVITSIDGSEFRPKWNESYPNLEYIKTNIEKEELYLCTKNRQIIACAVLNNEFDPEYENINWGVNANPDEIIVIHTFAIASDFAGKGIGKEIFSQIKTYGLKNNKKTVRVDIIDGNDGAQKVFRKLGFEYVDTVEMFHPAVGLEKFHLFECDLEKLN